MGWIEVRDGDRDVEMLLRIKDNRQTWFGCGILSPRPLGTHGTEDWEFQPSESNRLFPVDSGVFVFFFSHSENTHFQAPCLWITNSLTLCPCSNNANKFPPCWHLGKKGRAPARTQGSCCPGPSLALPLSAAGAWTSHYITLLSYLIHEIMK